MANVVRIRGVFDDGISKAVGGLQGQFHKLEDAVKSRDLKAVMTGVGLAAGAKAFDLLGSAISGAGDFMKQSIEAASDLNESLSKSRVVFGASARTIEEWGRTMAEAGGLSTQAAVEAAATFGNFLTSLVGSRQKAAEMSMQLVQLASDLASFNNLDPTEVLQKLRSGLSGEAEPMRSLGVFLSEAKVKAKAMEMGLADAHGELSEGAKVLARYQIIMEETKTAQGDFARTADGLANSQRRLNAELINAQAALGEKLLPAQLMVTRGQISLIDGVMTLNSTFNALTRSGDQSADSLRDQATALAVAKVATDALGLRMEFLNDLIRDRLQREQELRQSQEATERADQAAAARLQGLADAYHKTGQQADDAAASASKLRRQTKDAAVTAKDARASWEDLGAAISEAIFGPAILAGREAGLQRRLREIKDEMRKERDPLRIKELKGDLADTQAQLVETRLKLALLGDQTAKDKLRPWVQGLLDDTSKLNEETKKLVQNFARLMGLSAQVSGMPTPFTVRARQHGGPVTAGQAYLVGERGPELFVPAMSGRIIAHAPAGGPDRVVVHTQINLDGRRLAEVVDEHLGWRYATAARTTRPV